eukprot:scaffold96713_cov33-Phaeocystis_antarctica.AAC.1
MADYSSNPGDGWTVISTPSLLNTHKAALVAYYNSNAGLPVISSWSSSNCCFAMSSTARWALNSLHMYPANPNGPCCSCEAYSGTYRFSPGAPKSTLSASDVFTSSTGCSDNNNPGIFYKSMPLVLFAVMTATKHAE